MRKTYDKNRHGMVQDHDLRAAALRPGAKTLSEEYGADANLMRKWKRRYVGKKEAFTVSGNPSLSLEGKGIRELKKQLREAEMERDGAASRILKKQGRPVVYPLQRFLALPHFSDWPTKKWWDGH